jgi:hypothetical protein
MVGPHLTTALDTVELAASRQGAVMKIWGAAGVGPNFQIVGGGDRLCRSAAVFTPGDLREGATVKMERAEKET